METWKYEQCGSYRFRDGSTEPEFVIVADDGSLPNVATVHACKGKTEGRAKLIAAAPDLLRELKETGVLAYELMHRAAEIDRKLAKETGAELDCEIGEIVRLRQQLSRNNALIETALGLK